MLCLANFCRVTPNRVVMCYKGTLVPWHVFVNLVRSLRAALKLFACTATAYLFYVPAFSGSQLAIAKSIDMHIQPYPVSPVHNSVVFYATCDPCQPQKKGNKYTYKTYMPKCKIDHDYKNMAMKRPMSPHMTIFTMTMPAFMSIVQRATGILLAAYAIMLAGGTLFLSNGIETYVSIIQSLNLGDTTIMGLKLIMGAPFTFHYANGIRFCIWNTARMLDMKQVSSSAIACIIATVAGAVLFAMV